MTVSQRKTRRLDEEIIKTLYVQLNSFYDFAPDNAAYKTLLRKIRDTYKSRNLRSDLFRACLFLLNFQKIAAFRKKNMLRKMSYCIKMSYKPLPNYFL